MERWELSFSEINQALQARQFLRVKELLSAMEAPDTADLMRRSPPRKEFFSSDSFPRIPP